MVYRPWIQKQLNTTEQLTLSLSLTVITQVLFHVNCLFPFHCFSFLFFFFFLGLVGIFHVPSLATCFYFHFISFTVLEISFLQAAEL